MLILVGVTINFALNGGIITKAKQASSQYQIDADREALLTCVIAAIRTDGKVDFTVLDQEILHIEFSGLNGTYTSSAGNTFNVTEEGVITYIGKNSSYTNQNSVEETNVTEEEALLTLQELIDVDPTVSLSDDTARIYLDSYDYSFHFNIPNETIEFKALDFYREVIVVTFNNYWYDITISQEGTQLQTASISEYVADSMDIFRIEVLDENEKTVKINGLTTHGKELDTIIIPKTITNITGKGIYTIKEIGDSAFKHAGKDIRFADDSEVVSIGYEAFLDAFNDETVPKTFVFPCKLEYIGGYVLGCEGSSQWETENHTPLAKMDGTLVIPKTVTNMGECAFNQTCFSKVIFEEGSQIDHIGTQWFSNMYNLTEIHIPGTVQSISNISKYRIGAGSDNSEITVYYGESSSKFEEAWYFNADNGDVGMTVICTDGEFSFNSNR